MSYGLILSHQICPFLQGTTVQWIDDQKVPYATKGQDWVGFDTKESYTTKVNISYRLENTYNFMQFSCSQ